MQVGGSGCEGPGCLVGGAAGAILALMNRASAGLWHVAGDLSQDGLGSREGDGEKGK